jgi:hypothetical protein
MIAQEMMVVGNRRRRSRLGVLTFRRPCLLTGVYQEMSSNILTPGSEHATKDLKMGLKRSSSPPISSLLLPGPTLIRSLPNLAEASNRADQVFLPVLENSLKAQKLQSTLTVFEKSKFFFNLPGAILEFISNVCSSLLLLLTPFPSHTDAT